MIRVKSAFLFGVLAAVFVTGASLHAATITSSSVTVAATDAGGHGALPESTSFSLPEFDPALGTLTGVEVDLNLTYQGEVDIANLSAFSGPPTAEPFTDASSALPIDLATPSTASSLLVTALYSVASGTANLPSFSETEFPGTVTVGMIAYDPASADFALYKGLGSNSYTLSYGAGFYNASGPGIGAGGDANSSGTVTVTYTYVPTPEPSSLVLLGLGALALAGIARRRMRAAAA